ncbi:MAG TPA: dienelactone hydrolase family protein [Steroidobacteraceae bacterium]|jgi:carboxymethylenebutenolidase|nr:dienelactone hydrolase family protein [Steroidobacteraceae bacterium]
MCDDVAFEDMVEYTLRSKGISRRELGALTLGAGVAFALPRVANAMDTTDSEVGIKTPDGTADAYFVHPASGKYPAVLVWPDIFGLRPAFRQMGKRLAESGYSVLVVNPFYRTKKAPTAPEKADFNDPATRDMLMGLKATLNATTSQTDAKAFIPWLDGQASVDTKRKAGTTGYCMSGPIAFQTAAALPDRVGAVATFHGGGLTTDQPDSPHLLIPKTKARFLVAIAENDDQKQPSSKDILRDAFAKAGRPAEVEVYAGALHGWCPPDSAVYNADQAEKAWSRLLALFKEALA